MFTEGSKNDHMNGATESIGGRGRLNGPKPEQTGSIARRHQVNYQSIMPRWPSVLIAIVGASAFGPYVMSGVRTDQIIVYSLLIALLPLLLSRIKFNSAQLATVSLLFAFLLLSAIQAVFNTGIPRRDMLAMIDNIAMPLAASLIALLLASKTHPARLLAAIGTVTVVGVCANAALTLLQSLSSGPIDLGPWHPGFGVAQFESVGDRAAQAGRFTGFFNQPALGSILYGLAMLFAIYLLRRRPVLCWLTNTLLLVGGLLSVSKAFVFAVLPVVAVVAVATAWRQGAGKGILALVPGLVLVLSSPYLLMRFEEATGWIGAAGLTGLFTDLEQAGGISGGRLGEGGTVVRDATYVLDTSPFVGLGPGGNQSFPLDSLWLFGLAINGLIGFAIILLLAILIAFAIYRNRERGSLLKLYSLALVAILIGSSFGYPSFFGDRLPVLLWPTLILLLGDWRFEDLRLSEGSRSELRDGDLSEVPG